MKMKVSHMKMKVSHMKMKVSHMKMKVSHMKLKVSHMKMKVSHMKKMKVSRTKMLTSKKCFFFMICLALNGYKKTQTHFFTLLTDSHHPLSLFPTWHMFHLRAQEHDHVSFESTRAKA